MSLETKALSRGIRRIFAIPRLSLSLIIALGSTLGAVLCVIAITSALIIKPLPGVSNAHQLRIINMDVKFGGTLTIPVFTPHIVNHARSYFKDLGQWAAINASKKQITLNEIDYATTYLNASSNITDVLGTKLIKGQAVDKNAEESQIWISNSLWKSAFSGLDSAIGQSITIEEKTYIIAGILEDVLAIKSSQELLVQQVWFISNYEKAVGFTDSRLGSNSLESVIFKPMTPQTQVPSEKEIKEWFTNYIDTEITIPDMKIFISNMPLIVQTEDYRANFLSDNYQLVIALIVTVVGLLLMATLNLINLFLTHYQQRNKEFSIQLSVGASSWRLRWLMILENLPSFVFAGIFGVLLSGWLIKALPLFTNKSLPLLSEISIDLITLGAGFIIIVILAVIFGCLSLIDINKNQLMTNLTSSGKGTITQSNHWFTRSLMVLQLSIASLLVTGSVMLAQNSYDFVNKDIGIEPRFNQQLEFDILDQAWQEKLSKEKFNGGEYQQILQRLTEIAEKEIPNSQVVLTSPGGALTSIIRIMSVSHSDKPEQQITYKALPLGEHFFETHGIDFRAGQTLTQQQIDDNELLVVIDETFAQTLYPDTDYKDIIGKKLPFGNDARIVNGIVENTSFSSSGLMPSMYINAHPVGNKIILSISLPEEMTLSLEQLKPKFDKLFPRLELVKVESLYSIWRESTASQRLNLMVLVAITFLTLVLAAIGISGLTLMATHQKKYELAIRMATGATQFSLIKFIGKEMGILLTAGLVIGFLLSVFGYESIKESIKLLPEFNWLTLTILDIGLAIVVLLSVLIPTWRVIKQDPLSALRQE